jgi:diguanylate cyclase (GGDEF)-like protein/PAS domain S-box-containing protein
MKKYFFYFLVLFAIDLWGKEVIRFGVFAYAGVEKTRAKYQPLVDYLNTKLDKEVILEVLTQEEMDRKISKGEIDIATTNPTHFLVVRNQYPMSGAIATLISVSDDGKPTSKLAGVIIVRPESTIESVEDIRGKSISTPSLKHMGGFRAQVYELHENGVEINEKNNHIIQTRDSHQKVVEDVLLKKAEVGFIRDGIFEDMVAKGEIKADDLRLIHEQRWANHPYRVSTRLYPEWPVFAMPHTAEMDIKAFVAALFALQPIHAEILKEGIYGYSLAADYLEVEELSRHLRLPPYEEAPEISYLDIWNLYKKEILFSVFVLLVVLIYYFREQRRKKLFESLLDNMGDGVYGVNKEGVCTWINPQALKMVGYKDKEIVHHNPHQLFHHHKPNKDRYDMCDCPIHKTLSDHVIRTAEEHFIHKDGTFFPVSLTVAPTMMGAIVVFRDITEERALKETLVKSEASLKKAQSIVHMGSWELDLVHDRLYWSDEIYNIFEINSKQFEPSYEAFLNTVHPEDRTMVHQGYLHSLQDRLKYSIDHRLLMEDGSIKWVREVGDSEYDEHGNAILSHGTVQDITEEVRIHNELQEAKAKLEALNDDLQRKNNQLKELAMVDGLTQIPNRRLFDEMYEKNIKEVLREDKALCVLMIDVDYFKLYNDHYGHASGDECLIEIAKVLKNTLKRPSDMVARYGGEEFVVLLKEIDLEGAMQVAESLIKAVSALKRPHEYSETSEYVTISVGLAFKTKEAFVTKESLLVHADKALYRAKSHGRNKVCANEPLHEIENKREPLCER